ncbi:GLCTK kinase, partial [Crypturellus undulatus]|nr:GLCTK kinase [Crypturellus undulatus]
SMSLAEHARALLGSAVASVRPAAMLRRVLALRADGCPRLLVRGRPFPLHGSLYLVGFGKAVLGMAAAAEDILGEQLTRGIVSVPTGIQESLQRAGMRDMLLRPHSRIQVMEGAKDNLPDREALQAAGAIRELAEGLGADDLLLVLISGGGSALLPAPRPPVLLEEKEALTRLLASRGATIQELNTVRKALSLLKGGGLAQLAYPAQVVSLILSDVIGDPLDVIASGPTAASSHSAQDCLHILDKYELLPSLPRSVETVLSSSPAKPATPEDYSHVFNVIIGSNTLALAEAKRRAEELGYLAVVLSAAVCGDVGRVATLYCQLIQLACGALADGPASTAGTAPLLQLATELQIPGWDPQETLQALQGARRGGALCVLAGGETTVRLHGSGRGGRNQELTLRVALGLHRAQAAEAGGPLGACDIIFLSGGTDGQDGPTEAAGAVCGPELVDEAHGEGLDAQTFLSNNDSYSFFRRLQQGRHLLVTGLTGTNVMDIHVVLIQAK